MPSVPGSLVAAQSPCPVCGHAEATLVALKDRHGNPLRTVACSRCGLTRTDPIPTAKELDNFYAKEYRASYKGVLTPRPKHIFRAGLLARQRLAQLAPRLRPGLRLLDVGCSSGEWLFALQQNGVDASGIEANLNYASFGRKEYGVNIRTGSLFSAKGVPTNLDAITLFHVLEHLPDPLAALSRLRELLHPAGWLAIEVPHVHSRSQHPGKRFHYAHVLGFTPGSLRYLLARAGWKLLDFQEDADRRNLWAVVQPATTTEDVPVDPVPVEPVQREPLLLASAQEIAAYYLRPSTYARFFRRMGQFRAEFSASRAKLSHQQLLSLALQQ